MWSPCPWPSPCIYTKLVRYRGLYAIRIDAPVFFFFLSRTPLLSCKGTFYSPLVLRFSIVTSVAVLFPLFVWTTRELSSASRRGVYLSSSTSTPSSSHSLVVPEHTPACSQHQCHSVRSRMAAGSSARKTPTRVCRQPTRANNRSQSLGPRSNGPFSRMHRPRSFFPPRSSQVKNGRETRWMRPM